MTRRILGAHELGAPFGVLGCGMGLHATHVDTGQRRLAVILAPALAADPSVLDGLRREVEVGRARQDRGVAVVLDVGAEDDLHYAIVDVASGRPLRDLLADGGTLPAERGLDLLDRLAVVLDEAQAAGLNHWAISPRNVIVHEDDEVRLADLGLARALGAAERVTLFGPGYERAARILDGRSADLFSFGLLAREVLTGRPADRSMDPAATTIWSDRAIAIETVLEDHLADLQRPGYASAGALATALRRALDQVARRRAEDARRRAEARRAAARTAEQASEQFYERPTPRPGASDAQTVLAPGETAAPPDNPAPPATETDAASTAAEPPADQAAAPSFAEPVSQASASGPATLYVNLDPDGQARLDAIRKAAQAQASHSGNPLRRMLLLGGLVVILVVLLAVAALALRPVGSSSPDPAPAAPTATATGTGGGLQAPPREATVPPLPPSAATQEAASTPTP
jgi:serine/threonine-protein kinase